MDPLTLFRQRASKLGEDPEVYLLEHLSRDVDPGERVEMYLAASRWFWEEGMRLLEAGDVRQASEKLWNAEVQAVKAYAEATDMPHDSHRLIWAAVRRLARDNAEVLMLFAAVEQLHINFYEGHLERDDVEHLAKKAKHIIEYVEGLLGRRR
ncbi:MAG: PaREP1 family protein [Pyrobaculum sp.]